MSLQAVKTIEDMLPIVTGWSFVDERQIRPSTSGVLAPLYAELRTAIVGLLKQAMILLAKLLAFLNSKWSEFQTVLPVPCFVRPLMKHRASIQHPHLSTVGMAPGSAFDPSSRCKMQSH